MMTDKASCRIFLRYEKRRNRKYSSFSAVKAGIKEEKIQKNERKTGHNNL